MDDLILNKSQPDDESQAQSVVRRLQQATDGDWQSLWIEATPKRRSSMGGAFQADAQACLVRDLHLSGESGRALKALRERRPVVRDPARASEVHSLFPRRQGPQLQAECLPEHKWHEADIDELAGIIAARLCKKKKRTAQGFLGGRLEHWHVLQLADEGAKTAGRLLAHLALGLVPQDVVAAHARCEVAPSEQAGKKSLRPLQLGSVCRRIAMGGVAKLLKSDVQMAVGEDQLGAGSNDGCAKAYQALRTKCRLQPRRVILSEDCKSAHQSLERAYAAHQLEKHCPRLLQPFLVWYGET